MAVWFGQPIVFAVAQSQDVPLSGDTPPQTVQTEAKADTEPASTIEVESDNVHAQATGSEQKPVEQDTRADVASDESQSEQGSETSAPNGETTKRLQTRPISRQSRAMKEDDSSWPRIKLRARIMAGWEYSSTRPTEAQAENSNSEQQLFLQQARFGLKAELNKRILANMSADFSDALKPSEGAVGYDDVPYLRNAYINVRIKKAFQIRAGRFKRPFSKLENTSTGSLPFRGRGLSNGLIIEDAQWGDRAIGLMLWGKIRELNLSWKGSISNPDWNADNDMEIKGIDAIGQLSYRPIRWLSLGVNYAHKLMKPGGSRTVNADAFGGDFQLRFGGFRFSAEAFAAQLTEEENDPFAFGIVGYTSYDFELSRDFVLQPTLFGEYADANSDYSQTEAIRTVIGINLLCYKNFRVLPQLEIVRPVGEVSSYNPWISEESFYVLLSLEI